MRIGDRRLASCPGVHLAGARHGQLPRPIRGWLGRRWRHRVEALYLSGASVGLSRSGGNRASTKGVPENLAASAQTITRNSASVISLFILLTRSAASTTLAWSPGVRCSHVAYRRLPFSPVSGTSV